MNIVKNDNNVKEEKVRFTDSMRRELLSKGKTAFIGRPIDMCESRLYLICYSTIVDAKHPYSTFSHNSSFIVERYVDVEMIWR